MSETRVQFNTIVASQLPSYVREDFPLVSEFLKQYYLGQEYQGGPIDLIQNIDRYLKLDNTTNLSETVILNGNLDFDATTINVNPVSSPSGTTGFPDSYGLLKINNEIITYTGKTDFSFTGCVRGFVGITSYRSDLNQEEVVFEDTESNDHENGSTITNLSCLFLKEFLLKTKYQFLPGFEERDLTPNLNQNLFIKQAKDFYLSKGTDQSFEILFKALYSKDVKVVKPRDFLFTPSNASYRIVNDIVVEKIVGDPENLENSTLYQDQYEDIINKSYAPITSVEKIVTGLGKTFYKLSFDGGYNRDIRVDGAIYGKFSVEPTTKIIGQVLPGSTTLDVDSTVGFKTTGELYVTYSDTTTGVVSYSSKSLTQFFGVTNLNKTISDGSTVGINTFTYGKSSINQDEIIKVRVNSVLSSINLPQKANELKNNGTINISTLGFSENNFKTNKWIYNVAPVYNVARIELIDSSNNTYKVTLDISNYFNPGNLAQLIFPNGIRKETRIINITGQKTFTIRGQGVLDQNLKYKIQRNIQKVSSTRFPYLQNYSTDIDNVYKSDDDGSYLIASPSIPNYNSQPINTSLREVTFSGTFLGDEFEISPGIEHGFYTGDAVYYSTPLVDQSFIDGSGNLTTRQVKSVGLFDDGLYFVKRVNSSTLKFAKSKNDIFNSKFISVESAVTVSDNSIKPYELNDKVLSSQKLLRKISDPKNDGSINKTLPGFTGIFINGVEILNYKSKDTIKYGKIENIEILSPGRNIDVINPPNLIIKDSVGTAATGYVSVSGSLKEIRIKDPGFDYLTTPTLKIDGGNGQGAEGQVNMKLIDHSPEFFADEVSNQVIVGSASTQSRIGFSTYHKFRNAEQIIYRTKNQNGISGIVTDSTYFVSIVDNVTVKLHPTQNDAILGINTVFLSSYGEGKHSLQSVDKKSIIQSINIVNSGFGYENKKRTTSPLGINTASNEIVMSNHDYNSGEKINYTCEGTPISGLTTSTEYYVTKIDDNSFKLSSVGLSSDREFYYRTKQYINFSSVGVGTHIFNYPDITATIIGEVGISSIGQETFKAIIEPIFRGEITSVHLKNTGVGYGSSEIINLDRQPQITVDNGTDAQLKPIISNGRIVQVIVLNSGSRYFSTPDLVINGDGIGSVLVPVIENGVISSVTVIESGFGYNQDTTTIDVIPAGSTQILPEFRANIQQWRVNLFERYFPYFSNDDGVIIDGLNSDEYGLQYSHLYAPRKLRENVFSIDQSGSTLFGESDLRKVNSIEQSSTKHSPILGFAYDGNPIYGPYAYRNKNGGVIAQMKSGYVLDLKENRPPTSIFPEGFFVEDYTHLKVSDESILDENNGRFCITPDYPYGTYAYFVTINDQFAETSGIFEKYKKPVFPYIIGDNYNSIPEEFNFKIGSNQDTYNIEKNNYRRNTNPLNLIEGELEYPYVYIPNKLNQTASITATSPGTIKSVGIVTSGNGYRVGETLVFDNTNTKGSGSYARISRLKGRSVNNISVASSVVENVEVYPGEKKGEYIFFTNYPHNFENLDIVTVSGLSTTSSKIEGSYSVGIQSNRLAFVGTGTTGVAIGTDGVTGLVTFFRVSGNLAYPNIRENDILIAGNEKVKVLNIDSASSRIRVLRSVDGTVGSSHTIGEYLYEDPRKLTINSGFKTDYAFRRNEQLYFNPADAVGLGTTAGVGIGSTIIFSNPGSGITQIFIPTKSIYIKNHNLQTGDELTYSAGNGGIGIIVQDETNVGVGTTLADGQRLFVAKITDDLIGIATVRVGLGTTGTFIGISSTNRNSSTLFFTNIGLGNTHSFTTNHDVITGNLKRNLVTVSSASTHGLNSGDNVFVSVNPNNTKTIVVKYDDYNRRLLIDPIGFSTSGISTTSNSITLTSHGLRSGDKVIHTATSPSGGLSDEKIYYIVRVDQNTIKLSNTYFDSTKEKPDVVDITSASSGTINSINPPINLYKNSTITFDLSDSSLGYTRQGSRYPAFEFNFYTDKNCTKIWNKSENNISFEVSRFGIVGTSGAKVTLTINDNVPEILYYKLDVIYNGDVPEEKVQIEIDNDVISGNQILLKNSLFNGKYNINVGTSTIFTYSLSDDPESSSYSSTSSEIVYETDSANTFGPISKVEVTNEGRNYYSLPGITTVNTVDGVGAILEANGLNIGNLKKVAIKDIGFNYPSDKTLNPKIILPQNIKIESLSSFESIGISSFGRGYSVPPKLVVLDGKTNEVVPDVDLRVTLGSNQVEILRNTNGISNVTPTIIPTESNAGVGINTIIYDSSTNDVTVILSVGFSTVNSFPFSIGDNVLIENVSVGVGSTGKGYNSSAYNYELFTLTSVTENLGGIGSVSYNLSGLLESGEFPGTFDPINSSGRIIAQKHFPIFDVNLIEKDYIVGESVASDSATGIVEDWDSKIGSLKVSSNENFVVGEKIIGSSSNVQGIASSIKSYESFINLDSTSKVIKGWQNDSGELNFELQRIQDSFYYQNFSYSLKSDVDYDTWNDPVSSLNHTLGFRKFSDYQMETFNSNNMSVGITSDLTNFTVVNDLDGFASLHCFYDFDLVTENNLNLNSRTISNEIIFSNRILTDYFESIGNRVLSIDDLGSQFNSEPRANPFSIISTFNLSDIRSQKYITYVRDKRYTAQRQILLVDLVHDGFNGYLNQYGRVETQYDQGSFDFAISGTTGQLQFYPTKYTVNDYNITTLSYNLDDALLGTGTTSLGGVVLIDTDSTSITTGTTTTIVSIANTYTTAKILVQINPDISSNQEFESIELNIVHDGTNVELLEYGRLTTNIGEYSATGLGTYNAYIDGSNLKVDFIPSPVGIATTGVINTIQVGLASDTFTGIGTINFQYAQIEGKTTSVSASGSPGITTVSSYENNYDGAYFIVQVADTTNNRFQMSEIVVVDDYIDVATPYDTYDVEYGVLETSTGLGTFGSRVSAAGTVSLVFTPNPSIDTVVTVFKNAMSINQDDTVGISITFTNGSINNGFGDYTGTESDIKREFELKHKNLQIFERYFEGNSSDVVDIANNMIKIPNHFLVSGEKIRYVHFGETDSAIGIATTSFVGAASTTYLPENNLYVVKVDDNNIRISTSAEKSLKSTPEFVELESVGIGTSHRFISTNQNAKVIVAIDNIIQSPVVSTALTTTLSDQITSIDNIIYFSGITSFFGSDLIRINDEIMKIEGIGIGSTNAIRVRRPWLGTQIGVAATGDLVTKIVGNYNIVDNHLNFSEAPFGNTPIGSTTNPPDERDWTGITTSSSFQGRSFMRSGIENTSNESYYKNYIFDDVSEKFNGTENEFTLNQNGSNVSGISTENAIILINGIFQSPGLSDQYVLLENSGITSISFQGTNIDPLGPDIGISSYPKGGIIVSVGSTEGFGYQPLISAGGTAIVSGLGTISSISIGNSGSGYRGSNFYEILTDTSSPIGIGSTEIYLYNQNSVFDIINLLDTGNNLTIGVGSFITTSIVSVSSTFVRIGTSGTSEFTIPSGTQVSIGITNPQIGYVNVSIATSDIGVSTSVYHVGFATILTGTGSISTNISITNPGSGFTNPTRVIVDYPDSYSNIPLYYSSSSSGIGTEATIDVVVGQGSSVIDFEIKNTGYGYGNGEILTVPVGGLTGIPTTSLFSEFQLTIDKTASDEFTGWSLGTLQVLDKIERYIDGTRKDFPLSSAGQSISIVAAKGSKINVQDVLLIFVNNILQVPGESYIFNGGSIITFTEPLKLGDTVNILFYKGSGDTDVIFQNIIETVKKGDTLQIKHDPSVGQAKTLEEDKRVVDDIKSTNTVSTNPYFGPGNTNDVTLERPVIWCKQTEDIIIDEIPIGKDRELYESLINPVSYVIKSVGIGSTDIYVDRIRPIFDGKNENDISLLFQNKVTLISQDEKVGASATAVVSIAGTISSIVINDGGSGYISSPVVTIGSTLQSVGLGTTATATASITSGIVTSITLTNSGTGYTTSNPPVVLISPPTSIVETNDVSNYYGDSGIIVGFGTTTVSSVNKLILDLHIPLDSYLRQTNLVGTAVTLSSIDVGDYFIVYRSNVGFASTAIYSRDLDDNIIGIGSEFIDNVYQVDTVTDVEYEVVGVGTTTLRRVYARISGISTFTFSSTFLTFDSGVYTFDTSGITTSYTGITTTSYNFGNFSWGKINLSGRSGTNEFSFYGNNGVIGITTSSILKRFSPLKYTNYII